MVKVLALRVSDGAETYALVPAEDYAKRGEFGFVLPERVAK
jgi:hypothetical protein